MNYEPNSWGGEQAARASRRTSGFTLVPRTRKGRSCASAPRALPTTTARRGSSIISQTPVEQGHIAAALVFELSKVETPAIRERMVSHLLNIDDGSGEEGRRRARPEGDAESRRAGAAGVTDLQPSPALSIIANAPGTFKGRKLGVLVTDGVDAALLQAVQSGIQEEGASGRDHRPEGRRGRGERRHLDRGGREDRRRSVRPLRRRGAAAVGCRRAAAEGIDRPRFRRRRFRALQIHRPRTAAMPLFEKAGIAASRDSGVIALGGPANATRFLEACRQLRLWEREAKVKRV